MSPYCLDERAQNNGMLLRQNNIVQHYRIT
jgi:hypothetical protein